MTKKCLALLHRGSSSVSKVTKALRHKGYEPLAFTSRPFDDGTGFRQACAELGVVCAVSEELRTSADEVRAQFGDRLQDCAFCLAIWDGQREAMATLNHQFGAPDIAPAAVVRVQDKFIARTLLRQYGLSSIDVLRAADVELRRRLSAGERWVVKPRRGGGSLCTRAVTSVAEVERLHSVFERGPDANDIFEEFYLDNELIAESFFEGTEVSLDLVRQGGVTKFWCDQEKTVLEFTEATVLERGLASPPIRVSPNALLGALTLANAALDRLELTEGCYHVELRLSPNGAWDLIEINPRAGGGLISESILQQFGCSLLEDWIDALSGASLDAALSRERQSGTYFQLAYPEPGRPLKAWRTNSTLPAPHVFTPVLKPGFVSQGSREDIGAMTLWRTDLEQHRALVERLVGEEYVTFDYETAPSGDPSSPEPTTDTENR
jgi:hypothetical protein